MSFVGVYRKQGTGIVKVSKPSEAENIRLVSGTLNREKRREYIRMKIYEQAILRAHGRNTDEAMNELYEELFW